MGKKAFNTESFAKIVQEDSNGTIKLISEYKNISTKVQLECIYGHKFWMAPNRFRCGDRCPKCSGKYRYTTQEVQEELNNLFNNEYEILNEYKNNKSELHIKHRLCGTEFINNRDNIINGKRKDLCPKCREKIYFTNETYRERFYKLHEDLELLQNFDESSNKKIRVRCKKDNYEWDANLYWIVNPKKPTGCPRCKSSHGEKRIRRYLEKNNILYEEQKMFNDLRIQRRFKFDFCIYKNNKFFLLEYDGELHSTPYRNNEKCIKKLEETKMRDEMKNNYCKEKGIKLVRINYLQYDEIENILDEVLKNM